MTKQKSSKETVTIDDEALADRSVHILGKSSAAFKGLTELRARRQKGENVGIWLIDNTWIVGPTP